MSQIGSLSMHRVLVMPASPEPCALYFVKGEGLAEAWLTDKDGGLWPVGNSELISQIIAQFVGDNPGGGVTDPDIVDPGDLTLAFDNALA